MANFSQRMGFTESKCSIQINSMDIELRTRIWNVLSMCYFYPLSNRTTRGILSSDGWEFFRMLWVDHFNFDLDLLPRSYKEVHEIVKNVFFAFKWNEVYDFIEFIAQNYLYFFNYLTNFNFIDLCNEVLERELSGYRFINEIITPIHSNTDIATVNESLDNPLSTVKSHISRSLELLSDRTNPDFRNSIKESISAVEAICESIVGKRNASLGDALKIIKDKGIIELHPALNNAFNSLYGYTSNADGIRHALSEESILSLEDAIYMLVSCSAFANYLTVKADKVGIVIT
ncbi:MAG: hypothetical protein WAX04_11430 [Oscillospiraceae bacterium]